jgi:catechol 2,3-dioxygenase-like lactoylglutathione lyase family enzyme
VGRFEKVSERVNCRPLKRTSAVQQNESMDQSIVHVALVVRDYDEAIEFYTEKLGFTLVEDSYQPDQDKRWVVVAPPGSHGTTLLLARASNPEQATFIGNQSGGRVFLFLNTDDFWRDYQNFVSRGVQFVRAPKEEEYGTVAVFQDLYGNLWDLLELKKDHPIAKQSSTVPRAKRPDATLNSPIVD